MHSLHLFSHYIHYHGLHTEITVDQERIPSWKESYQVHVWSRYLPTRHTRKSLEIWREILLLVPHPSKKDRFPFWMDHAYPTYNLEHEFL